MRTKPDPSRTRTPGDNIIPFPVERARASSSTVISLTLTDCIYRQLRADHGMWRMMQLARIASIAIARERSRIEYRSFSAGTRAAVVTCFARNDGPELQSQ